MNTELTEEQKERIRINRERALEIRRQRESEEKLKNTAEASKENNSRESTDSSRENKRQKLLLPREEDENVELEQFEEGASEYVNKMEAMKMYCLPEGTLSVCSYIEKQNPRHKSWTPMKLYSRAEIRKRARERWGGIEGLQAERRRREESRYKNDLEKTKNVFKK